MQTFKALFERKQCSTAFKALYERECHVCPYTLRIFGRIEDAVMDLDRLAAALEVQRQALQDLKDAEYCDPRLVAALCRHLGLDAPRACPRMA